MTRLLLLALLALGLEGVVQPAQAVDANTCGYTQGPGGWYRATDRSGPYSLDGGCNATLVGPLSPNRSAGVNRSTTVTTTAANVMPQNSARSGWKVRNDCSVSVWINFDGAAAATPGSGNVQVVAGGYLASEPGFVETGAMSAVAASGTCALTAREQ